MFVTLMYHIVDRRIDAPIAVSEEAFEAQLAYLRRADYEILSLSDVLRIVAGTQPAPPRGVFVTFDDGYADNLHAALPRLREHGIEATMFVPTAYVGESNAWNQDARYRVRHLGWKELGRWVDGGGRIGGHTHDHASVLRVGLDELRVSLELNKRLLEERVGQDVRAFAYPYGHVTDEAVAAVATLYDVAFSVSQGSWGHRTARFALNRLAVDHQYRVRELADSLERLFDSFEEAERMGREHRFEQFPRAEPRRAFGRRLAAWAGRLRSLHEHVGGHRPRSSSER